MAIDFRRSAASKSTDRLPGALQTTKRHKDDNIRKADS
jgi:hypothetical protein